MPHRSKKTHLSSVTKELLCMASPASSSEGSPGQRAIRHFVKHARSMDRSSIRRWLEREEAMALIEYILFEEEILEKHSE